MPADSLTALQKPWPGASVEMRNVADLLPYARNPRTHSKEQVAQIARSIEEFGFTVPVLVGEDGVLIAGHGRVLAAKLLGLEKIPCMVAVGWSEAQRRAYIIADNKLTLNGGWDEELLREELAAISAMGFDIELTGFNAEEILAGLEADQARSAANSTLAERFGVPPFSVLRASEGWWQTRKQAWLALGIESELGRGETIHEGGVSFAESQDRIDGFRRKANAIPSGAPMPLDRAKDAKRKAKPNAEPGGSKRPAANYKTRARGDGKGRAV